jgi:hypothetical protein
VRTHSRAMARDALPDFEQADIFTTNATVLPRSFWKYLLPFQRVIRIINDRGAHHDLTRALFAREFEAVALKAAASA